jgi:hypothetical protein
MLKHWRRTPLTLTDSLDTLQSSNSILTPASHLISVVDYPLTSDNTFLCISLLCTHMPQSSLKPYHQYQYYAHHWSSRSAKDLPNWSSIARVKSFNDVLEQYRRSNRIQEDVKLHLINTNMRTITVPMNHCILSFNRI